MNPTVHRETTFDNGLRLSMRLRDARNLASPGDAAPRIEALLVTSWSLRTQMKSLMAYPDDIRDALRPYGAWDAKELSDDRANERRFIWIAACNIAEENR
jgi:hypothetical protein